MSEKMIDSDRAAFEAWLSSLKFVSGQGPEHVAYCLHRDLSDQYTTEWVRDMYRGWQARASLPVGVPDVLQFKAQVLELIGDECKYWQGKDEARRGGFAVLYAKVYELEAPAAQPTAKCSDERPCIPCYSDHGKCAAERVACIVAQITANGTADAYVGAMEDKNIWKRRALEAEEKLRVYDQRIVDLGVLSMKTAVEKGARDAGEVRVPVELLRRLHRSCAFTMADDDFKAVSALLAQRERGGE